MDGIVDLLELCLIQVDKLYSFLVKKNYHCLCVAGI